LFSNKIKLSTSTTFFGSILSTLDTISSLLKEMDIMLLLLGGRRGLTDSP